MKLNIVRCADLALLLLCNYNLIALYYHWR